MNDDSNDSGNLRSGLAPAFTGLLNCSTANAERDDETCWTGNAAPRQIEKQCCKQSCRSDGWPRSPFQPEMFVEVLELPAAQS